MKCCRFCNSEKIRKNGIVFSKQRYKCKECGRNFREYKPKYDKETTTKIVKAYLNGVGFRAIGRIFDIPRMSVFYIIKKYGKKLEELKKKEFKEEDIIQILEADELFTYVGKKTKSSKSVDSSKQEHPKTD